MPVAENSIRWRVHKIYRSKSHNRILRRLWLLKGAQGHLYTNPPFFTQIRVDVPETTLESDFKRIQFRSAVWTKGRFVKTYINYRVSFF